MGGPPERYNMKVILVFPPFYLQSMYNLPPLGLINLATLLKVNGHSVTILDMVLALRKGTVKFGPLIYDECAEMIMESEPDMVGFSAQCTTYPAVIGISKKIKSRDKQVKIVVGGHNASFVDVETLQRYPWIDAIVRGEGELSFLALVQDIQSGGRGEGIAGVTYMGDAGPVRNASRAFIEELDSLPIPDYSLVEPLSVYRDACGLPRAITVLEVGRGCPHNCVYCSESVFWGRRTRTFSITRLVSEMARLSKDAGAECFVLAYDQFTARRRFVESFCRELISRGLNRIPWYCISRLDTVDAPLLRLMKEAGCESMCYGIDSGSKRTLSFIRKQINHEILYDRVRMTTEEGMVPTLSFVIGFPEEERPDVDETLSMALRTGVIGNNNPLIQMPTVLPGTDLHRLYLDGLVREVDTYFALGLEFDNGKRLPEDEELINNDPFVFSSFYNLPCKGLPLKELGDLADFFPLAVRLFPRTFLLMSLEGGESISLLFGRWARWVRELKGTGNQALSARDFYLHFKGFVAETRKKTASAMEHLDAILEYEQFCLEAARHAGARPSITMGDLLEAIPLVPQGTIVAEFAFDVPAIILDLKEGIFNKSYPPRRSTVLFRQFGDQLETASIDDEVKHLMELCDGRMTTQEIIILVAESRRRTPDEIKESCVDALIALSEAGYIELCSPQPNIERR
jgi:radical SAM superfamily enzyme YgiQ (UPF0313 family)